MDALLSLSLLFPEMLLVGVACALLVIDLFSTNKKVLGVIAFNTVVVAAIYTVWPVTSLPLFYGMFTFDPLSIFFKLLALFVVGTAILLALSDDRLPEKQAGEFYVLLLFMAFGLILMGSSSNLLMIFLSIEFVSLLSYILTGFQKSREDSTEAALKYLLFGSVASAVMLFGMSLLFALTGCLDLGKIGAALVALPQESSLAVSVAIVLVSVGLGFKISMVPFHMWAPDVYQGAPTPVTALLTVGPKTLGFAVALRFFLEAFRTWHSEWSALLQVLSILTMTLGNVIAISQTNIKRLLGYSSIAQAGYILMGLAVSNRVGVNAVLIYAFAYAITNLAAFSIVTLIGQNTKSEDLEAYAGLAERSPLHALSLTLALLSLAGIPPLVGFIGKWYVFASAIQGGYFLLAVAAAVNSVIAAFYYFRIVRLMYLVPARLRTPLQQSVPLLLALLVTVLGLVALGLFPQALQSLAEFSSSTLATIS